MSHHTEATMYYEADANTSVFDGRTVAVLGYGSQGHAHAGNLADSGVKVLVGLREGSASRKDAEAAGHEVTTVADAAKRADIIMVLLPDEVQAKVYKEEIAPNLNKGDCLLFAHGFNVHFGQIVAPEGVDVAMIAPKGPGHLVRRVFTQGGGVPALFAVHTDATGKARDIAMAWASHVGGGRAGMLETTFREETETDLFGEQAVLCGGAMQLLKSGFEVLVEAGYQPEIAYFECLHELKLIVDLMYEGGMAKMRHSISDTAEYGDYVSGPRVVDEYVKDEMRGVLKDIQDGTFARNWILENQAGRPGYSALKRQNAEHQIEEVGKRLRAQMTWLNEHDK